MTRLAALLLLALAAAPLAARESLGVYESWAAFRDPTPARCYAIARAQGARGGYATVSNWPEKQVRGAVYFALSREVASSAKVRLSVGGSRFDLVAKGRNAWARDARDDAAIIAALRSAGSMSVSGSGFTDRYTLAGAATAIDAATVGCAKR
jgi:hypothetical protein